MKKYLIAALATSTLLFAESFTLKSSDLEGQLSMTQVFNGFGCSGKNISPELNWEHAPKGTKSFALTVYDPDAPTGSGWWHWVAFNIPSSATSLPKGAGNVELDLMPKGTIQSVTDFAMTGYGGACPPEGDSDHQYIFTLHALDIDVLRLDENARPALVGFMINKHTIERASLISYYGR